MEGLAEWAEPDSRDRVIGNWRPVDTGDRDLVGWKTVLATRLPGLVEHGSGLVRQIAQEVANRESIPLDGEINFTILADESASSGERIAALRQVVRDGSDRLDGSFADALGSNDPNLRSEARLLLLDHDPDRAVSSLEEAIDHGTRYERQSAIRALGVADSPSARRRGRRRRPAWARTT